MTNQVNISPDQQITLQVSGRTALSILEVFRKTSMPFEASAPVIQEVEQSLLAAAQESEPEDTE